MKLSRWKLSGDCYLNEAENYIPDRWLPHVSQLSCGSGICEVYRPSERGYKKSNLLEKLKSYSYVDEVLDTTETELDDANIIGIDYMSEGQFQSFIVILAKEVQNENNNQ